MFWLLKILVEFQLWLQLCTSFSNIVFKQGKLIIGVFFSFFSINLGPISERFENCTVQLKDTIGELVRFIMYGVRLLENTGLIRIRESDYIR